MSDIALVGTNHSSDGSEPVRRRATDRLRPGTDRCRPCEGDLWRWQQQLSQAESPSIRWDRIAGIRAKISSGDYLTPARLDAAVDGLLRDIDG
ncbi:MAG: flagellar biosynthesis anti-sigma factor FlgM [Planctomycetes bacterium]|jgi:hypothetical protein|nr:flagellar biosynthesis anti-sigma factor FlgM [Planctomycetota bacterium]